MKTNNNPVLGFNRIKPNVCWWIDAQIEKDLLFFNLGNFLDDAQEYTEQANEITNKAGGGSIGDFLSGLFGGKSEDRSAVGYNNAIAVRQPLPYYPSKMEMIRASQSWENHIKAAINDAYDEQTGTWESPANDWKGIVTSVAPITAMLYKGSRERFPVRSSVYSQPKQNSIQSIFRGNATSSGNKPILIVGIAIAVVVVVVGALLVIKK